jgi:hypothetical protein
MLAAQNSLGTVRHALAIRCITQFLPSTTPGSSQTVVF